VEGLVDLILQVGFWGIVAAIFAESGLFFGFFLPGDSLLLTAGLLASRGLFNIWALVPALFIAAFLGDQVGYWFGAKTGPRIFSRDNSLLFKRKNLLAAKAFYEKHGGKTIVLARFMPFIRTFAPIVAGAAEMRYARFVTFNLLGAFLWAACVTLIGYFVGETLGNVPGIDMYFTIVVLLIIFISALPAMIHLWRDNKDEILQKLHLRRAPEAPAPQAAEAEAAEE
jgi:membrane-associated protein